MKTILITGATGNIGSAISKYLAEQSNNLILAAPSREKLTRLAENISPIKGTLHCAPLYYGDRNTYAGVKELCKGSLDGLVLITPRIPATEDCLAEAAQWERLFKVAFIEPLMLIKALLEELGKSERAKVVIISGIASVQYLNNYAINGAIRAAWLAQAKAMAYQYGAQDIHFNTLSLGGIMTDVFCEKLRQEAYQQNKTYEEILQGRVANVPLKKYASLSEVAKTVSSLLSEMTDHMTGMNFICDGGFIRSY